MNLPDFIIAGAPRSGTTWLYELLARHPRVYMAQPKKPEPKFFLVDEIYSRGLGHYSRTWFEARPASALAAGEKSTNYLESPEAASRIARDLPGVKLVFILREPCGRAWSNWLWSRQNGMEKESFARALELEDERERTLPEKLRFARPHAYYSRGLYAELLAPWLERFPLERVLVLRFEDVKERPAALAERLHRFLGVEPRPADGVELGVVNPAAKAPGETPPASVMADLFRRYEEPNGALARLVPGFPIWRKPELGNGGD